MRELMSYYSTSFDPPTEKKNPRKRWSSHDGADLTRLYPEFLRWNIHSCKTATEIYTILRKEYAPQAREDDLRLRGDSPGLMTASLRSTSISNRSKRFLFHPLDPWTRNRLKEDLDPSKRGMQGTPLMGRRGTRLMRCEELRPDPLLPPFSQCQFRPQGSDGPFSPVRGLYR